MYKVLLVVIALISCAGHIEKEEKNCGVEMSVSEVAEVNKTGANYNYKDSDLDLLADITTGVHELFNDQYEIEVFFAMHSKDKIALYVIVPDDENMIEKIRCYILTTNLKDIPKNRLLLFYSDQNDTFLSAFKTKTGS